MKAYPLQASFSSGEISPRLWGRPDTELYKTGVRTMLNMIARSHGPAERRGGFEYVISRTADASRIFNFQVNAALAYIVAVMPGFLEIFQGNGLREIDNVVPNNSFRFGGQSWEVNLVNGGTVSFNSTLGTATLVVSAEPGSIAAIAQTVPVTPGATYYLVVERPQADVYLPINIYINTGADIDISGAWSSTVRLFKALITIPAGVTTARLHLQFPRSLPGELGTAVVNSYGLYLNTGANVAFVVPYTVGDLRQLRFEQPPNQTSGYLVHPLHPPQKVSFDLATNGWTLIPVPFVGAPSTWVAGSFPGSLAFFQGRSWWGGSPIDPETIWASRSGVLEDLTPGAAADNGMSFTLSKKGGIRWISALKNLVVGTDTGEFILTAKDEVIIPGDIQAEQQSAFGSTPFTGSVNIGNSAAYVTGDRRKVRITSFRWEESQYVSVDLTFPSEHISADLISSLMWTGAPDNQIVMADGLGNMISCTYEPTLKIVGWHRHASWQPFFDFTVQQLDGRAVIWCARRTVAVDGTPRVYFERYDSSIYLDSFMAQVFQNPTTTVPNLQHLEGQVVQVVVDGAMHPDRTVSAGQIELGLPGRTVMVGKGYLGQLRLLPWETQLQGGVTMGMKKRYGKVWARLLTSGLPTIDGEMPPDRSPPSPMNRMEPLVTRDVEIVSLGWKQQEDIVLEQRLPLPLLVLAVFGEVNVGSN